MRIHICVKAYEYEYYQLAAGMDHLARAAKGSWNTAIYTLWRDLAIQLPLTAVTGPSSILVS